MTRWMTIAVAALLATTAAGQWRTQQAQLVKGWNAVYVNVDPVPWDCDAVFGPLPVHSVWKFDRQFSTVQFTEDPQTLFGEPAHWLVWYHPTNSMSFLTTLQQMRGGQAYLVKADQPCMLTMKGVAVLPTANWLPEELNFMGFPVGTATPPSFEAWFAPTPAIDTSIGVRQTVYEMTASGVPREIRQTGITTIAPGAAYWVRCQRPTDYVAPFDVDVGADRGMHFGDDIATEVLSIANRSSTDGITVEIRQLPSETPPWGYPGLEGEVPLSYYETEGGIGWTNLPAVLSKTLAPEEDWRVRLAPRRTEMTQVGTNTEWQSVLRVTDAAGSILYHVPVTAGAGDGSDLPNHYPSAGLWVGDATLTGVSRPAMGAGGWDTGAPLPTLSSFRMRLIVHVDATGEANLLQRALVSWYDPPGTNREPHYAIWTDEAMLPEGTSKVYRVSSVGFPPEPTAMTGAFGNILTCINTLDYDHPNNPFRHPYHPDHDNLDAEYATKLAAGKESFSVNRAISMNFNTNAAAADPFWGVERIDGDYEETISGLRKRDVNVSGTFELQRVCRTGELNR